MNHPDFILFSFVDNHIGLIRVKKGMKLDVLCIALSPMLFCLHVKLYVGSHLLLE